MNAIFGVNRPGGWSVLNEHQQAALWTRQIATAEATNPRLGFYELSAERTLFSLAGDDARIFDDFDVLADKNCCDKTDEVLESQSCAVLNAKRAVWSNLRE